MTTTLNTVFPPPPAVVVPVVGSSAVFPVRRIYCVGRNYADHAREMGSDPQREPPFFFSKPSDALVPGGGDVAFPSLTQNYHHEVEMVVAVGKGGANIPVDSALEHVFGYAVGLDMTRRDLQLAMKNEGKPWDIGKGADQSAPISAIRSVADIGHPTSGAVWLKVNGETRQQGNLDQMSWSVAEVIARLSTFFALAAGDLIFTGTPAGVGKIVAGDQVDAGVDGIGTITARFI